MKPAVISRPAAIGNYAIGRPVPISRITWHHIVGDAPAAIQRFQTPGIEVSTHYVIGSDGTIYQCVADANTAYGDGSADSNRRTISIEHAGGIASVPYTDAMYAASIRLIAWLIKTYGITDFKRHRDVIDKVAYPGGTACPGTLDVERIITGAQALLKGDKPMVNKEYLNVLTQAWFMRDAQAEEVARYVDKADDRRVMDDFNTSNERQEVIAAYHAGKVANPTILKAGTYVIP